MDSDETSEMEAHVASEASMASLPRWMRYMPNPPWKQSSNLNLQLPSDDQKVYESNGIDELVSCDSKSGDAAESHLKSNTQQSVVETDTEQICSKYLKEFIKSKKCRGKLNNKTKRKKILSNPFSTTDINFAKMNKIEDDDQNCTTIDRGKKRRRLYNENSSSNLEDTVALLTFCKFNK